MTIFLIKKNNKTITKAKRVQRKWKSKALASHCSFREGFGRRKFEYSLVVDTFLHLPTHSQCPPSPSRWSEIIVDTGRINQIWLNK